jgi:hypothetical protein
MQVAPPGVPDCAIAGGIRCQVQQCDFGTAGFRAQLPANAVSVGERSVEQRNGDDLFAADFNKALDDVDAVDRKRFL